VVCRGENVIVAYFFSGVGVGRGLRVKLVVMVEGMVVVVVVKRCVVRVAFIGSELLFMDEWLALHREYW
jgi:hypothetical protein